MFTHTGIKVVVIQVSMNRSLTIFKFLPMSLFVTKSMYHLCDLKKNEKNINYKGENKWKYQVSPTMFVFDKVCLLPFCSY